MVDGTNMHTVFYESVIQGNKNKYMKWFGTHKGEAESFGNCPCMKHIPRIL